MGRSMGGVRYAIGGAVVGRLPRGADLLEALAEVARRHGVRTGWYQFFGAVERARLAFYDQARREYLPVEWDRPLEIAAGVGNVSLLDGEPFVHAHVTLSDREGRALGGHVLPGTVVFAAEYVLWELAGAPPLERHPDPDTGLRLWPPA